MGNSQSNDTPKSSTSGAASSPSVSPPTNENRTSNQGRSQGHTRRNQAQASLPINSLTKSLVTSGGAASTSTSSAHAHATVAASPQRTGHTRVRSTTLSSPISEPPPSSYRSDPGSESAGYYKPPRSSTLPSTTTTGPSISPSAKKMTSPPSQPVDVPQPSSSESPQAAGKDALLANYSESPYGLPPANYSRPPRLPLPIEEEVHTPGSPIITPQDIVSPLDASEVDGALPRKASVLSSTTVDEDEDVGDNDAFAAESSQSLQVRIPTRLEWNGEGEKIFVTGTFCNWEKKMKLHDNKNGPGFSAHVLLPPGTHHIKFLVDGEMMTSNDLPTTVDWTNILVNYIEIVAPLPPAPAEPISIPGTALSAGQDIATDEPAARPRSYEPEGRVPDTEDKLPATTGVVTGSEVGQPPSQQPSSVPAAVPPTSPQRAAQPKKPESKPTSTPAKQKLPRSKYTNQIPDFLLDLDNYNNPEDERFQRASKVANNLPQPPSLPMFLSKSILNSNTPHKDDASVLVMPNHTVINHLATSSIRSGVLATSGTTRYKRKFLTTIMYKPTTEDG